MIIALILHRIVDVRVLVKYQEFGKYYMWKSLDSKIVLILTFICVCEFSGEYELCTRVWRKTMASYHLNQIKLLQMVRLKCKMFF